MKLNSIIFATLTGAAALTLANGPQISANYTVQPAVLDGGGARSVSSSYSNRGNIDGISGTSASGSYDSRHGYIAQLAGECPAFMEWQITHFGSVSYSNAGPSKDPDNDGVGNLAEFAFNMNPNTPDASALPSGGSVGLPCYAVEFVEDDDRLAVEFVRRTGCGRYVVEGSVNLTDWKEVQTISVGIPVLLPGGFERVKLADSEAISIKTNRFLRVKIEL